MKNLWNLIFICLTLQVVQAQTTMNVFQTNGSPFTILTSSIDSITYSANPPPTMYVWHTGGDTLMFELSAVDSVTFSSGGIQTLDCGNAIVNGNIIEGGTAAGLILTIPYSGGNGGGFYGSSVNSTGVTGLSATLGSGSFVNGNGVLQYTLTGIPSMSGTAYFDLNVGGQSCTADVTVDAVGQITLLSCDSSVISGSLVAGAPITGISLEVPYDGGNGGVYNAQSVNSVGVTGLTASISNGALNNGTGSLNFTIAGTPDSSGTAFFPLNIGGQNCTVNVAVDLPVGLISGLNCDSAIVHGTMIAGTPISGVSIVVPYVGGNGGTYGNQIINSTGVTGLTATINSGILQLGDDSMTVILSGTPPTNIPSTGSDAYFDIYVGGENCAVSAFVYPVQPAYPAGSVFCGGNPTLVVDLVSPTTGRVWMDRNLGAMQAATHFYDTLAMGDLYQAGRFSDGHQCRNSPTTNVQSSSFTPNHNAFILGNGNYWTTDNDPSLWSGVFGINNPCPEGYRIPLRTEEQAEAIWAGSDTGPEVAFTTLKRTATGYRDHLNQGEIVVLFPPNPSFSNGCCGYYYNKVGFTQFGAIEVSNTYFPIQNAPETAVGRAVRCIKDNSAAASVNLVCDTTIYDWPEFVENNTVTPFYHPFFYTGGNGSSRYVPIYNSSPTLVHYARTVYCS